MKISLLEADRLIQVNKLEEVTSQHLFSNRMMYDPNGLLSNDIFGISKSDRRSTFAYITLKKNFIHPHLYAKVLKSLFKNIEYIIAGQKRYAIKDGWFVEDSENGWTGISSLYDHWDEIDWNKKRSDNKIAKELMGTLSKNQVFIDKIIVIPPAYRDVMLAGTLDASDHVSELNDMYQKLIRAVSILQEGGLFARTQYGAQLKVQTLLVDIYKFFTDQIAHKTGLIRRYLLGKSIDYGVRAVISAPTYNHERFEDNMVDVEHTAVPIEMCCSAFYPFIAAWLKNFFTREIINDPNLITFSDPDTGNEFTGIIKDADIQFSEKNIRKMINDYCLNPDNRFKAITMEVINPADKDTKHTAYMILKGNILLSNNASQVLKRPMTITDIIYLACVDVCEKRHVMVSRYPVGTDKGIYLSKVRVQSTVNHVKLVFNGKEYPYYPDIDLKLPTHRVGVQFIDTLVPSNSHLDGMGADLTYPPNFIIWNMETSGSARMVTSYKNNLVNAQQAVSYIIWLTVRVI